MYFVIAEPLFAGNVHDTAAEVEDPIAVTTGATGAPTTIGDETATEPKPTRFFAATRKVYAVPFVSPVNTVLNGLAPTDFVRAVCATVPMYGVTT
jgi:hypothetical protein